MNFPERLKKLLKDRRISQEILAEAVGVSQNLVSRWATGKNNPDIEQAAAVAEYFGVSLDHLATGKPDPAISPDDAAILEVRRAMGLTMEQAIQGLTWAAGQRPVAPSVGTRVVAVRDETGLYEREEAERLRREREAARIRSSAKKPDKIL